MPVHPKYDLLAVDLDGTLLDPLGRVSARNAAAITRARDAGIQIVVCTGRGLIECRDALEAIAHDDPAVVAGGAIIACPTSGRTLHRFPMNARLVTELADALVASGHAALVLKDPAGAGYDYLVVTGSSSGAKAALDPITAWWFEQLRPSVRFAARIQDDEHPEHTVRVGLCGSMEATRGVAARLNGEFDERIVLHDFPAVVPAEPGKPSRGTREVIIIEAFDRAVSKWTAIEWVCGQRAIATGRVAAIGDQINDLAMIRGAGLGIAMGNAVDAVKKTAAVTTGPNTEDGVAAAVDRILAGEW
jgi:hydroxymethylpyrimidine pyrophosphatase-like HAD family hydrolase